MRGEFTGLLRERVIVERPVTARTSTGVQQFGWTRVASCLAAIVPEGVGAQVQGQALSAAPRFVVTIRQRDGIAIDQRLRWGTRVLAVRELRTDPRLPDRIVLRCEEARG